MTFSISVFLCIAVFCLISLLLKVNPWLKLLLSIGIPIYLFGVTSFIGAVIAMLIFSALFFIPNFIQAFLYFGLFCYINQNFTWWMYIIAFILSFPFASFASVLNNFTIIPVYSAITALFNDLTNHKPSRNIPYSQKDKEEYFESLDGIENLRKLIPTAKIDASYYPELDSKYQEWENNKKSKIAIPQESVNQATEILPPIKPFHLPLKLAQLVPLELVDLLWICALQENGTTFYENIATSPNIANKIIWKPDQDSVVEGFTVISLNKTYLTTNGDIETPKKWDICIHSHNNETLNKVVIKQSKSPFAINQELFGKWENFSIDNYLIHQGVPFKVKHEKGKSDYGAKLFNLLFDTDQLWLIYIWSFGANGKVGDIQLILYSSEHLAKQDQIWSRLK